MFTQTINPVILHINNVLSIRWYGLVYAIGFIVAYWWMTYLAKNQKIKNLTQENVDNFVLLIMLGVVVGGRFFEFVFFQPQVMIHNPLEILRIWNGGMSFHGGIIGVSIVTYFFCKKHKISLLELGDAMTIPAAFALFLGRIANFINSELVGKITHVKWCVNFPNAPDPQFRIGCRHPSQLYESFKNLVILGVLLSLWKQVKIKKGTLMWSFITLYGLLRFLVNFWRDDPLVLIGLSMGQILSILMFILGSIMLIRLYKKELKNRVFGSNR